MERTHSTGEEIECPFCREEFGDLWDYEMEDDDTRVMHCDSCDRDFVLRCQIDRHYWGTPKCSIGVCSNEAYNWDDTEFYADLGDIEIDICWGCYRGSVEAIADFLRWCASEAP